MLELVGVPVGLVVGSRSVVVTVVVVVDGTGQSGSTLNKRGLTDSPVGSSIVKGSL